jgi:hypothetical protein
MVGRQIEIDEETDRVLTELARAHEGSLSAALAELVQARENIEALVDQSEATQSQSLRAQLTRSELGFREGRFTTWDEVKRRNGL